MNAFATEFVWSLMQASIALTLTGLVLLSLLKVLRVQTPWLHRAACLLVLLEGWCLSGVPLECGWSAPAVPVQVAEDVRGDDPAFSLLKRSGAEASPFRDETMAVSATTSFGGNAPRASARRGGSRKTYWATLVPRGDLSWAVCLVALWGVGGLGLVLWTVRGYRRFVGALPDVEVHDPARHAEWADEWRAQLQLHGVFEAVPLVVTCGAGPALCRLPGGYRLLVPVELWRTLTARQREAILRHEVAHYLRGDIWKSAAVRVLAAVHWFNPAGWWMVRRFDECAEWACDEAVRAAAPQRAFDLAHVLLCVGQRTQCSTVFSSPVWGSRLSGRIQRLVKKDLQEESRMKRVLIVMAMAVVSLGGAVRFQAEADEHEVPTASKSSEVLQNNTNSTPETPSRESGSAPVSGRDAVIDVARVFKSDARFEDTRKSLLEIRRADSQRLDKEFRRIQGLHRELEQLREQSSEGKPVGEQLMNAEAALASAKAAMDKQVDECRRKLLRLEAENYSSTYDRILAAVREHAREQGFKIVRRESPEAKRSRQEFRQHELAIERAVGGVEFRRAADPGKPSYQVVLEVGADNGQAASREIMARINQEVLYTTEEPQAVDITDAIIERLNAKTSAKEPVEQQDKE